MAADKTLQQGRALYTDLRTGKLRARRYRVEIVAGTDRGKSGEVDGNTFLVGTASSTDLRLTDHGVSRHHLELRSQPGGLVVTDLESTNGTFQLDIKAATKIGSIVLDSSSDEKIRFRLGPETELVVTPARAAVAVATWQRDHFGRLVGGTKTMRTLFGTLAQVATSESTVLLEGETGTGKELLAEAVHHHSARRAGPYVVVDCGALARELIGSELFGHVKGAFTGATQNKRGLIEEANGGTVFLDEVGELPRELQPHLLRVIEKREVRPIGDTRARKVDVRFVAATNRALAEMVRSGGFRQDLFFRLAVVRTFVPPLREHKRDIPLLVRAFLRDLKKPDFPIPSDVLAQLMAYDWPGNVRELRNIVERSVSFSSEEIALPVDAARLGAATNEGRQQRRAVGAQAMSMSFKDAKNLLTESFERDYLTHLLARHHGNVTRAAAEAGLDRNHMHKLIRKYQLTNVRD